MRPTRTVGALLSLLLLASAGSVCGCGKRPYTAKANELKGRVEEVRGAAVKATALTPPLASSDLQAMRDLGTPPADKTEPVKLDPPPRLGGSKAPGGATSMNTLVLAAEDISKLSDPSVSGNVWLDDEEEGATCLREAAAVLEKDECLGRGCTSEGSKRCTQYLLGLRYVLIVKVDVNTDDSKNRAFHPTEVYGGRAVLIELATQKSWPAVPFAGAHHYATSDSTIRTTEVHSPVPAALKALSTALQHRFPAAAPPTRW